ncbi:hypothetical protein [Shewanella surugensis]|uniref:Uncharacterized protein n=1 Tax=Shewanella surugensis TaxID=212020 RepID=A0ABT0L6Q3_9GAMM|nr:hypothetical protein [Shewanella surugensis]MCL1123363.1 hypothetical protein [Shewanella surugensis]
MTLMILNHINAINDDMNQNKAITDIFDGSGNTILVGNNRYNVSINETMASFEVIRDGWQDKNIVARFFTAIMDLVDRGFSAETRTDQLTSYLNTQFRACLDTVPEDPAVKAALQGLPKTPADHIVEHRREVMPLANLSLIEQQNTQNVEPAIPQFAQRGGFSLEMNAPVGQDVELMGCSIQTFSATIRKIIDPDKQRALTVTVDQPEIGQLTIEVKDRHDPDFVMRLNISQDPQQGSVMSVEHIRLLDRNQGQGIMSEIINKTLLKCPKINVFNFIAGDSVGAYAWPKYGAVPTALPQVMDNMRFIALMLAEQKFYSAEADETLRAFFESEAESIYSRNIAYLSGHELRVFIRDNLEEEAGDEEDVLDHYMFAKFCAEFNIDDPESLDDEDIERYREIFWAKYQDEFDHFTPEFKTQLVNESVAAMSAAIDVKLASVDVEYTAFKAKIEALVASPNAENFWTMVDEDLPISAEDIQGVQRQLFQRIQKLQVELDTDQRPLSNEESQQLRNTIELLRGLMSGNVAPAVLEHDRVYDENGNPDDGTIKLGKIAILGVGEYEASMPLRDSHGRRTATAERMINYSVRNMSGLERMLANRKFNQLLPP